MIGASSPHDVQKAITFKGPFLASAILHGVKKLENRSRPFGTGWFAVHTGVSNDGDAWAEKHVREAADDDHSVALVASDVREGLVPKGSIAGLCRISHWLPVAECGGSPWAIGPYCGVIAETVFLDHPVVCGGQLGAWGIPSHIKCLVNHSVTGSRVAIRVSDHAREFPPNPAALSRAREAERVAKRAAKRPRPLDQPPLNFRA